MECILATIFKESKLEIWEKSAEKLEDFGALT